MLLTLIFDSESITFARVLWKKVKKIVLFLLVDSWSGEGGGRSEKKIKNTRNGWKSDFFLVYLKFFHITEIF